MSQSKPQTRTVEIKLDAPYEGWVATMRADGISARVFIDLQSGDVGKQLEAMARIIVSHNFLDETGEPATSVLDAPMDAISQAITKWGDAVTALPPR